MIFNLVSYEEKEGGVFGLFFMNNNEKTNAKLLMMAATRFII